MGSVMPNFLIARLSVPSLLGRKRIYQNQNAFIFYYSMVSAKLPESIPPKQQLQQEHESFTVSYLINSCGLSSRVAVHVSKSVRLKNSNNADSVLNLLRSYGFSKTHISKCVEIRPQLLSANPEKTLLPKLMFLHSIGFSCTDLPEYLVSIPQLLCRSLEKSLIPRYEVFKNMLVDDDKVLRAIKLSRRSFLYSDMHKNFIPNVEILRQSGVPQSSVLFIVLHYPGCVFTSLAKFVECVKSAKEMGFDPLKFLFIEAVKVLSQMKKSTWESKLRVYERFGWSRDVALSMFRKYPFCMTRSEQKISKTKTFLVDEMGWTLDDIARYPLLLSFSLKERIIPRCSVIKILKMERLVKNYLSLSSFLKLDEKKFLKYFVTRFQERVPLLLNVYEGRINPDVIHKQDYSWRI